ncbi:MAG: hypothetical protein PQJ60_07050 [Spirochaetales bacterium]|nr:hypothetical protein [Spirochaetales bacterium]
MNIAEFIETIEGYYSPYENQVRKAAVVRYLERYKPNQLSDLLDLVISNHFVRLGTPCMASIERIHREYNEGDPQKRRESHVSLKKPVKEISACSPEALPVISDEERAEVERMLEEEGGILGMIHRQRNSIYA